MDLSEERKNRGKKGGGGYNISATYGQQFVVLPVKLNGRFTYLLPSIHFPIALATS